MRAEFSDQEEALIGVFISSARQWCEEYLQRAIGLQELELRLDGFPSKILLRCPLKEVTSVVYKDPDGVEVTLDESEYIVADAEPATIRPLSTWPRTQEADDAVVVTYWGGYMSGSPMDTQELPKTLRTAMLMMVADMYANREAQVEKPLSENKTVERLISTLRLQMGQ
jgi:uncharacterized phiE125 gp8 family phage protein